MQRYKIIMAYDGTQFAGFQAQPNQRTIQGVLEQALKKMTKGTHVEVFGSGRTDAGVHALAQVAHFDYPGNPIPAENMKRALNSLMPFDIEILSSELVSDDFHARFAAHGKHYEYRVSRSHYVNPFNRFYTGHYPYPIELARIETALGDVVGTHDFTSFCASGNGTKDKVRTIYAATVREDKAAQELIFNFNGNGFLYNMVRIIVGTLLEIGNGRREVHDFLRLYEVKDRQQARVTAPASGLYLKSVDYSE